jgi:thiol-disulfide isomerase/thioredoxin
METAAPVDTLAPVPTEAAAPMGSVIGAFSTVDLQGNAVDSNVFANKKLTLVNVWATFCPPCVGEIPELAKLDQEIDGFQVLGILADAGSKGAIDTKNLELGKKILSDSGAVYTSILPDDILDETLMNAVYAVPTSFFVDQNGQKVGEDIMGALSYDDWKAQINEALSQIEAGGV